MKATSIVQMDYQNPHASAPLTIPVHVVCNTPDEDLHRNIRANAALDLDWVGMHPAHDGVAVMVGGGPSLADHVAAIEKLKAAGGTIFAMNAASGFLSSFGLDVDYQVIADAKPETATLVDPEACRHFIASQVHRDTIKAAERTTLWHLAISEEMDELFPPERIARGGYALIGGGAAVGNSALCLAYVKGFRTFEIFGYDSSHRGDQSHAYDQPMNRFIPCVNVEWAGKTYYSSVAMKAQAEKFQITGQSLEQEGCKLTVHGDGLLPAMWNTSAEDLTERDKYRLLWATDSYRESSPGEMTVAEFLSEANPSGLIVDFGCGTGRAAVALAKAGHSVFLVDFADNCRDPEAVDLPFLEWDLSKRCPVSAPWGICCDVMEHIPPEIVPDVVRNIMASAEKVFFQISTVADFFGVMIGTPLHLSVHPASWWRDLFTRMNYRVEYEASDDNSCRFIISRKG